MCKKRINYRFPSCLRKNWMHQVMKKYETVRDALCHTFLWALSRFVSCAAFCEFVQNNFVFLEML